MGLEAECDEARRKGGRGLCSLRKASGRYFYVFKDNHSFEKCVIFFPLKLFKAFSLSSL